MIGIIGAMEEEITLLRNEMKRTAIEKKGRFEFIIGTLCGKEVVLLRCGIGKVQAAAGCTTLINCYTPSLVINTGCAGGINPLTEKVKLNFGDAIISSALVYHDFDVTTFGYQRGQVPGTDSAYFAVDVSLMDKMAGTILTLQREGKLPADFKAVKGVIASGDIFVSDSTVITDLLKYFPALRAVEMESTAIAHCCTLFGIPYIILRCLSDMAGEESPVVFSEYLPIAARHSSEIVKRLVTDI